MRERKWGTWTSLLSFFFNSSSLWPESLPPPPPPAPPPRAAPRPRSFAMASALAWRLSGLSVSSPVSWTGRDKVASKRWDDGKWETKFFFAPCRCCLLPPSCRRWQRRQEEREKKASSSSYFPSLCAVYHEFADAMPSRTSRHTISQSGEARTVQTSKLDALFFNRRRRSENVVVKGGEKTRRLLWPIWDSPFLSSRHSRIRFDSSG